MSIFWENFPPSFEAGWTAQFDPFEAKGAGPSASTALKRPSWQAVPDYLALETFRIKPDRSLNTAKLARTFISSGTTAATRSQSGFSERGLALYRTASLLSFFSVISKLFPESEATAVPGISLVPQRAQWPDSSLAQMVAWIAERGSHVSYSNGRDFADRFYPATDSGRRPLWVFGTAFHFVHLMDSGQALKLPEGSVLIETGGTKGRSREISREDFYRELSEAFGIPESRIASEYGMCELASQAYDWVAPGETKPLAARRFRFPKWVCVSAVTGPGEVAPRGDGLLLVDDLMRVDAVNAAIRTEDLAAVDANGAFCLLGRAPSSPLRGCSLNAEELLADAARKDVTRTESNARSERITLDRAQIAQRAAAWNSAWPKFLAAAQTREALEKDLGSDFQARLALADLAASAPRTAEKWAEGVLAATAEKKEIPHRWLMIAPGNHPLAALQPIALGAIAGAHLVVRLPAHFSAEFSFLNRFLAALSAATTSAIETRNDHFRLNGAADTAGFDAILAYGSDETIAAVRAASGVPVVGFGNRAGVALLSGNPTAKELQALVRDAFSLGQTGCMAARLALFFCEQDITTAGIAAIEAEAARVSRFYLHNSDAQSPRIEHELERARLELAGFSVMRLPPAGEALFAAKILRDTDEIAPAFLAMRSFTLPMAFTSASGIERFVSSLATNSPLANTIGTITASPKIRYIVDSLPAASRMKTRDDLLPFRPLGAANAPLWSGRHEGRSLLAPA